MCNGRRLLFQDGRSAGVASFTAARLAQLLHGMGADPSAASTDWVADHARWVVWKLARWEVAVLRLAGRLLTVPVVLDQLAHRCVHVNRCPVTASTECSIDMVSEHAHVTHRLVSIMFAVLEIDLMQCSHSDRAEGRHTVATRMPPHHKRLTPATVRLRRYDRELVHGHWSAVRRIIDGRPPHSLVLRVASVQPADGAGQPRPADRTPAPPTTPKAGTTSTLLLTDGWHGISAAVDPDLQELVIKGIIRPGTTLLVCAATLEATVPPRLSLYYNSTFRYAAVWPLQCCQVCSTH